MRALERDPARRWQTAGELATELRRAARDAYGEPPHKKAIAAFVEDIGGEELDRLQRLIRLGTEGAAVEAIEAEHPGVTKVLAEDASGVARVGTGALRTSVIEDGDEEEDHGPPTLLISTDENTPPMVTREHRRSEPRSEDPTHGEDPLDRPIRSRRRASPSRRRRARTWSCAWSPRASSCSRRLKEPINGTLWVALAGIGRRPSSGSSSRSSRSGPSSEAGDDRAAARREPPVIEIAPMLRRPRTAERRRADSADRAGSRRDRTAAGRARRPASRKSRQ
jgi:hypothetical protein